MPRPRKDGRLRMDTSLRIPVTSEQKQVIADATRDEPEGMAAWARAVLLRAAREQLNQAGKTTEICEQTGLDMGKVPPKG